jgi:hypothetical protein
MSRIEELVKYIQSSEPSLAKDGDSAIWENSADNDRTFLVHRRGANDQIKVELGADAEGAAHGHLFFDSADTTAAQSPTYTKLAGTTTGSELVDFDMPTDGRLRYIGQVTRKFFVTATGSINANTDQGFYYLRIAVNGTTDASTRKTISLDTSTTYQTPTLCGIIELSYGDYLEIYISRLSAAGTIRASNFTIDAFSLPSLADTIIESPYGRLSATFTTDVVVGTSYALLDYSSAFSTARKDFVSNDHGRLQYVGSITRTFFIVAQITASDEVADGDYRFRIYLNGTTAISSTIYQRMEVGITRPFEVMVTYSLSPGDYVEVWANRNTSGSELTVVGGSFIAFAIPSVADSQLQADTKQPQGEWKTTSTVDFYARSSQPTTVRLTLQDGKQRYFTGTLNWAISNGVADLGYDEAGSQGNAKWLYFYAVPDSADDQLLTIRASDNPPSTGPAGYTDYRCVWKTYIDGSGNLIRIIQVDNGFYYAGAIIAINNSSFAAYAWRSEDISLIIPVGASYIMGYMRLLTASGQTAYFQVGPDGSNGTAITQAGSAAWDTGPLQCPILSAQTIYSRVVLQAGSGDLTTASAHITGWLDIDVEG